MRTKCVLYHDHDILSLLKYPHKAKVIITNTEEPANAYKENSLPSSVCLDLETTHMEQICRCIQTVTQNIGLSAVT
jgi:hypothetical protein